MSNGRKWVQGNLGAYFWAQFAGIFFRKNSATTSFTS